MIVRRFVVPVVAATLVLGACQKDPPPPPAPTGPTPEELAQLRADSLAEVQRAAEARAAAEQARLEAAANARRAVASAREALTAMVFFDYDVSEIRADQESVLRGKVDVLRASPQVQLRIEGHADERGSTEYNIALGNRRAEAVRQYLAGFGISDARLSIVSFGEERPLVNRSDEDAWARNRRAEFQITAGANAINPPGR